MLECWTCNHENLGSNPNHSRISWVCPPNILILTLNKSNPTMRWRIDIDTDPLMVLRAEPYLVKNRVPNPPGNFTITVKSYQNSSKGLSQLQNRHSSIKPVAKYINHSIILYRESLLIHGLAFLGYPDTILLNYICHRILYTVQTRSQGWRPCISNEDAEVKYGFCQSIYSGAFRMTSGRPALATVRVRPKIIPIIRSSTKDLGALFIRFQGCSVWEPASK